jgi:3-isopropylmalate/(R)-2-methylmalate dehydratase small subunit
VNIVEPFTVVEGPVSWLPRDDVDTDQILPKQHMKRIERSGYGQYLFEHWRARPGWNLPVNPILVTGRNFGCGSSREHAVWALRDYGFRALIAPSFADIFRTNCTKVGLLPVVISESEARAVGVSGRATIDLAVQEVRYGDGHVAQFDIDPGEKERLLAGLDDVALTLRDADAIAAYEGAQRRYIPRTTAL